MWCLLSHLGSPRLLACGKEAIEGFSIGVSDDEGRTFWPMLHFMTSRQRACDASSAAGICAETWVPLRCRSAFP